MMKRKKFTSVMFLMTLLCIAAKPVVTAAEVVPAAPGTSLNQQLVAQSIELTCIMDEFTQSKEYIALSVSQSSNLIIDLIEELGKYDYTEPDNAVVVNVPDELVDSVIERMGIVDLSEEARRMLRARMFFAPLSVINGQQGMEEVVVSSMLSAGKAYSRHEDFTGSTYVILLYENTASITCFISSGDGIVGASSMFVFLGDDIKAYINEENLEDVFAYIHEMIAEEGSADTDLPFDISTIKIDYIY